MIKLYNSMKNCLDQFIPINKNQVKMYVCGPTVYDYIHIGNARCFVMYDVLYRLLIQEHQEVIYVRNITDVDDKIDKRANELGISIFELTNETIKNFHLDLEFLNCIPPSFEPKATNYIEKIIDFIDLLMQKNAAYKKDDAIYFRVNIYDSYYALSGRKQDQTLDNARGVLTCEKEHKEDFVLWKPADTGQTAWDSKFGKGRPGWHTECSVMSYDYLGDIDIHGGGVDLIFPHHTNELAQSSIAFNCKINYWVHTGALMVNKQKMSKSLGNFITVKDLKDQKIKAGAIRMFFISASYRKPLDFTFEKLDVFIKKYQEIEQILQNIDLNIYLNAHDNKVNQDDNKLLQPSFDDDKFLQVSFKENQIKLKDNILLKQKKLESNIDSNNLFTHSIKNTKLEIDQFILALKNDLNTPLALSMIYKLINEIKKNLNQKTKQIQILQLKFYCNMLGII